MKETKTAKNTTAKRLLNELNSIVDEAFLCKDWSLNRSKIKDYYR